MESAVEEMEAEDESDSAGAGSEFGLAVSETTGSAVSGEAAAG